MTEKVFLKVIRPQIPIDIQDRLSRNSLISIYDSPSPEYDEEVHKSEIESEKSNARFLNKNIDNIVNNANISECL